MTRKTGSALKILVAIALLLCGGCGTAVRGVESAIGNISNSGLIHLGRRGPLSDKEQKWSEIAWSYFENNYNPETGFVNSTDQYSVASMWHVADYIAALYCARELDLIEKKEFDERFSTLLHRLNSMELAFGMLPNVLYNTKTGSMVNFANQHEELGWSIVDIGRLLFWLNVIKADASEFSEYIDRVVLRFSFCEAIDEDGKLYSGIKLRGELETVLENAIGYSDYAQLGLRLWGLSTSPRLKTNPQNKVTIHGIDFELDSNWARRVGTYGALLSGPYLYSGIETHWKMPAHYGATREDGDYLRKIAEKIYQVQENRYEIEGISTARTDHQLNRPPYYLQDSIYANGYAWSTVSDDGTNYKNLALVSTRAVFGMWALWKTNYTDHLIVLVEELFDKRRGWYEGRYEISGDYERAITISTNAMVLETLTHKLKGGLFEVPENNQYALHKFADLFQHPEGCLPKLTEN